jgi:hypothetical protein
MDIREGVKKDHDTLNIIRKGMIYLQSFITMKNSGGSPIRKTLIIIIFLLPSLLIRRLLGIIVTIVVILPAATTRPISISDAFRLLKNSGKRD